MDILQSSIIPTDIASAPYWDNQNPIEIELNVNKWDGRLKRARISTNIESLNMCLSGS